MENITIKQTGLFSSGDAFYALLNMHNIKTVKDLFDNENILKNNKKCKESLLGFCELLRFIYLGEDLKTTVYLEVKAQDKNSSNYFELVNFSRMGFNTPEITKLKIYFEILRSLGRINGDTPLFKAFEEILSNGLAEKKNDTILKNKISLFLKSYKMTYISNSQITDTKLKMYNAKMEVLLKKRETLDREIKNLQNIIFGLKQEKKYKK